MDSEAPLIIIVGPTASGKSDLAMDLASEFGGEIVCADSRTVYRGMDIGTAKPTTKDQQDVPHHLLDVVYPDQRFTVADFQRLARSAIVDIRARGKIPFLVGGTGLYVDSILFDYKFNVDHDPLQRELLEKMSVNELKDYCLTHNVKLPENTLNKRHLVRSIERNGTEQQSSSIPLKNSIIVGIATEKEILKKRITKRAEHIFESEVVTEAKMLGKIYGWKSEAMSGNIYPLVQKLLKNEISLEDAKQKFITQDWKLAKKQMTWFKRSKYIEWKTKSDAHMFIKDQIVLRQK